MAGAEQVIQSANPWDTYAVRDLELAHGRLRACQADTAGAALRAAAPKCAGSRKKRLNAFANLAVALARSDHFEFAAAVRIFNQSRNDLELSLDDALFRRMAALCGHWEQVPGRATPLELWANAQRRAGQGLYNDAVGRLYRAVELRAQQLVRDAYGVELGQIAPNAFPPAQGDAVRAAFGELDDAGRYKLGLRRLFQSLEFNDDATMRQPGSRLPTTTPSTGACKIGTNRC